MAGPIENVIIEKLTGALSPSYLEVLNESYMHSVPKGSESHFKVTVVSDVFEGKLLVGRHRMVNEVLAAELEGAVHALAIHTYTPEQWEARDHVPGSPSCRGGMGK